MATDGNSVYNLKRHMAALPPMSLTVFQTQALTSDTSVKDEKGESSLFQRSCTACEQHFVNRKAWQAHLKSRIHAPKTVETDSETSSLSDEPLPEPLSTKPPGKYQPAVNEEEETFRPSHCLFCNLDSASLDSNLMHMLHAHGFFIPDAEYLIDMESLLSYLFAVISIFHECLFCGRAKSTKVAVQDHMRGKGHCKADFEEEDVHDLKQFYDFDGGDGEGDDDDDDNDDDDDDDEGEQEEEEEEEKEGEGGTQPKTHVDVNLVPITEDDELRLPSGKILGHRSRARFFRHQDFTNHPFSSSSSSSSPSSSSTRQRQRIPTAAEAHQNLGSELPSTAVSTTELLITSSTPLPTSTDQRLAILRAGTSTSLIGLPDPQFRALIAIEKKMEKMALRAKNEYQHVLEKGGNRQKRFKVASLGKKQGGLERRLG